MEKDFDQMNYYELLDVQPGASALEIRTAYNAAMQMYQPDSLVSYSFFSREERDRILALLDTAYFTLINEAQRAKYDQTLNGPDMEPHRGVKKPVSIFDIRRQSAQIHIRKNHTAELKTKISQSRTIAEILSKQEIRGADFRAIRNELGVTIEAIHQETKIRLDYLNSLEEDRLDKLPATVFLKGFVKAYLKSLCIDPVDDISTRYINSLPHKN